MSSTARTPANAPRVDKVLRELRERGVVYTIPGMDRVTVHPDVIYKTVGDLALRCDVYLPPEHVSGMRAHLVTSPS